MEKLSITTLKYITLKFSLSAYFAIAQVRGAGSSIVNDMQIFKDAFSEWGSLTTGLAFLISLTLAVTSIFIPWNFFKQTIGKSAWISVACSLILFFTMSFFGNSIHKGVQTLLTCGVSIMSGSCNY